MRVAVVGSRTIKNDCYDALCEHVPIGASEIISGGAEGADALAARYAGEQHLLLTVITPNYAAFGRRAPLERTDRIIARADYVLALWDGSSRGTAYAVDACLKSHTPVRIIFCNASAKGGEHAKA